VTRYEELRALGQRYARAVDGRDVTALEDLFHPDAQIVGTRGTQSREEWLETMRAPRTFPTSMHLIGDPLIVLDDDGRRATLDSYAVVYQLSDPGSGHGDLTLGIRYVDDVVIDGDRWVILRRQAQTMWMR
jgi:SnoaL-like domain